MTVPDTQRLLTLAQAALVQGPKGDKGDPGSVSSVNGDPGPNVVLTAASVNAVPTTRTVNTKPLSADVTLTPADTGAASASQGGAEKVAALSATSGTATGNCANASVFTVTPTAAITLAFSNVPATGTACTVTVVVTQGATAYAVNLPSGGVWLGSVPTQAPSKACVITLLTVNGGTTWYASAAVQA